MRVVQLFICPIAIFLCATTFTFGMQAMLVSVITELTHLFKIRVNDNFKNDMWDLTWKAIFFFSLSILMFLVALMTISSASAEGLLVTGGKLSEVCSQSDPERQVACTAFVAGVANSYMVNSDQMCIPPQTNPEEVVQFVKYYLGRNPNLINENPAANLVLLALKARWPCLRNDRPKIVFKVQEIETIKKKFGRL